jgi:hypothetical protein
MLAGAQNGKIFVFNLLLSTMKLTVYHYMTINLIFLLLKKLCRLQKFEGATRASHINLRKSENNSMKKY